MWGLLDQNGFLVFPRGPKIFGSCFLGQKGSLDFLVGGSISYIDRAMGSTSWKNFQKLPFLAIFRYIRYIHHYTSNMAIITPQMDYLVY